MSKVLILSRTYPSYHPKKGQPTYFVEKLYNSIYQDECDWSSALGDVSNYVVELNHLIREKKHHTIRAGSRFKVGEKFSPRVWSGKPYASKQIIIAPDVEVKKVWNFTKDLISDNFHLNSKPITAGNLIEIAHNDGLKINDFFAWFNKPFNGQIIAWSNEISY